ncbi:hypothetical protein MHBO_004542, partial [Bonamia ostreae]
LYINQNKTFLIDRSFEFFEIKSDFYNKLWKKGNTILDGELIFQQHKSKLITNSKNKNYQFLENKPIFLIFDIVQINGENVGNLLLNNRFVKIGEFNGNYRQFSRENHPLAILAKTFFKTKSIQTLFSMITFDSTNKLYIFNDKRRNVTNLNDGLVFTPENDDYLQRKKLLFKWKWPELNTFGSIF